LTVATLPLSATYLPANCSTTSGATVASIWERG